MNEMIKRRYEKELEENFKEERVIKEKFKNGEVIQKKIGKV